jgi:hypothetical protein
MHFIFNIYAVTYKCISLFTTQASEPYYVLFNQDPVIQWNIYVLNLAQW